MADSEIKSDHAEEEIKLRERTRSVVKREPAHRSVALFDFYL